MFPCVTHIASLKLKFGLFFVLFLCFSNLFSEFTLNAFPLKLVFNLKSYLLFVESFCCCFPPKDFDKHGCLAFRVFLGITMSSQDVM